MVFVQKFDVSLVVQVREECPINDVAIRCWLKGLINDNPAIVAIVLDCDVAEVVLEKEAVA